MTERDEMRALAEAHGCGGECVQEYVRPVPCVRDEGGEIRAQSIKALLAKVDEELNELKGEIYSYLGYMGQDASIPAREISTLYNGFPNMVEEEAADTITAITTMLEALGIDADMRDEAQRAVNRKNRDRGRL